MTDDNEAQELSRHPGEILKQTREAKGYTRQYVAEQLRLTVRYISSLEDGCFDKLPGPAFIRGYIRIYTRLLEIPADELITALDNYLPQENGFNPEMAIGVQPTVQLREKTIASSVFYSFIVILGLTVLAWWIQGQDSGHSVELNVVQEQQVAKSQEIISSSSDNLEATDISDTTIGEITDNAELIRSQINGQEVKSVINQSEKTLTGASNKLLADVEASVVQDTVRAVPKRADYVSVISSEADDKAGKLIKVDANGEDLLHIVFVRKCWLEVSNGAGDMLYADLRQADDELELTGKSPFHITLGNAPGVRVSFNHQHVDISPHIRSNNRAEITVGQ